MITLRIPHGTGSAQALMRWCAWTMAILAMMPFTPPFSTCDVSALVAGRTLHDDLAPSSSRGPSIANATFFVAQSEEKKEGLRNLALAPAAQPADARISTRESLRRLASNPPPRHSLVSSPVLRI